MKQINEFPDYEINEAGLIYSNNSFSGFIKPILNKDGYHQVSMRRDGKHHTQLVHRLVALTYIPNPLNKPEVNHKNLDKTDNRVVNLEWCTRQENVDHYKFLTQDKLDEYKETMTYE